MAMSPAQRKLFNFLVKCEKASQTVSVEEMAEVSGLKPGSIRDYISKGYMESILLRQGKDRFAVTGTTAMTEVDFHRAITQSNAVRDLGHGFRSFLAKPLLSKSRDNMILALELYNRPSLVNRIDGFAMLFCAAWEQLLKARSCEEDGEASIFRAAKPGRTPETRSLRELVESRYPVQSPVRRNLMRIVDLRDQATHLLLPELLGTASRLFQSGVSNYAEEFRDFSKQGFLSSPTAGLLTLVNDEPEPSLVQLTTKYGPDVSRQLHEMMKEINTEIASVSDTRFAIPIEYKLVFSKSPADADIAVSTVSDVANTSVLVVEKPVDPARRCPHTTAKAAELITKQLKTRLAEAALAARLSHKGEPRDCVSSHDFVCIVEREGWKKCTNEYHYIHEISNRRSYSDRAIETAVERILASPEYLHESRERSRTNRPA
jgi:hypothetical protein